MAGQDNNVTDRTHTDVDRVRQSSEATPIPALDAAVLAFLADAVGNIDDKTKSEVEDLRKRQKQIFYLQKLIKYINANTLSKDSSVTFSDDPEIKDMLAKAKELGVNIDETKLTYDANERERLIENIRLTTDDLSTQNEMQIQKVNRYENERHEMYQMANSMIKTLHNTMMAFVRGLIAR